MAPMTPAAAPPMKPSARPDEIAAQNLNERLQRFPAGGQPCDETSSITDVYCEACEEAFVAVVTAEDYDAQTTTFPILCHAHELERRS